MPEHHWSLYHPVTFQLPVERKTGLLTRHQRELAHRTTQKSGGECPCCGQHAQVYRRSIYKRMAKVMLWLVDEFQKTGEWITLKEGPLFRGGDNAKLAYWNLVQTRTLRRTIEGHTRSSGQWMPTPSGIRFAKKKGVVPKYAYVYNGEVVGYSEEMVTIADCLEGDFDYSEILGDD